MWSFLLERKHCRTLDLRPVSLYSSRRFTASRANCPPSGRFFVGHRARDPLDRLSWLRTFYRAQDWQDPRTFFGRTIGAGGDSARMLINLGALELSEGHLEQADMLFQRALSKNPEQPFALLNLGAVALKRNDLSTARGFLERAQKNPVSLAQAEEMLALVEQKEKGEINLLRLRTASRTNPPSWPIMRRYLAALAVSGQTEEAVAKLRAVLKTEWYRAESWQLLSDYLARLGETDQADKALAQARSFDVHLNNH